ncbi:MAG: dynamin family protein [Paracoccaceae bacterium]
MTYVPQDLRAEAIGPAGGLGAGPEPLADFAALQTRLRAALHTLQRLAGGTVQPAAERLLQELATFEPAVTVLGQVKSGKTLLVNALAGWPDLLPTDVNPWTSVVTALHLAPGPERDKVGARFHLMRPEEWDRLLSRGGRLGELAQRADAASELEAIRAQIEAMREKSRRRLGKRFELLLGQVHEYGQFDSALLERYICLGDDFAAPETAAEDPGKQGWFADITRSAELYLRAPSVAVPICLRDTPGVNDTFLMREQVTIGALRDARVCVVVLSAQQALSATDLGLLRLIATLSARDVILFVNRIDELSDPAAQVPQIEAQVRQTLARHNGPAGAEIVFGSALWATKALAGAVGDLPQASGGALVNWAEAALAEPDQTPEPAEMVWHLSGLPALHRAISRRMVTVLGRPHLLRVASAAVTLAGGIKAASVVQVGEGAGRPAPAAPADHGAIAGAFDALRASHAAALSAALADAAAAHQDRIQRAHAGFLDRATQSLLRHLEQHGDKALWSCDPNGLRILLKSAHAVYASRAAAIAGRAYKAAVEDVAGLLFDSFGDAAGEIELALPEVPEAPAPVALAQTIILDFNDGWWASWWRRARGYRAFSDRFARMIADETAEFIALFGSDPPRHYGAQLMAVLGDILGQGQQIAAAIAGERGKDAPGSLSGSQGHRRQIEALLDDLRGIVRLCDVRDAAP